MQDRFHSEELAEDQFAFLLRRYDAEMKKFRRALKSGIKLCTIAALIFTFLFFVINKFAPIDENDSITERVSDGMVLIIGCSCYAVLMIVIAVAFVIAYFRTIGMLKTDIHSKAKIVERSSIVDKKYMPHNETYHFVLDSPIRYSIEVSKEDFYFYEINDEINLEYTYHSKIDLGYF